MSGLSAPPTTHEVSTEDFGRIDRIELNRFAGLRAMGIEWAAWRGCRRGFVSGACVLGWGEILKGHDLSSALGAQRAAGRRRLVS